MEQVPAIIGNCKIMGRIGQGGMGAVYHAVHQNLGRSIALKLLPPEFTRNPEYIARFMREARAVATLNHPNIVGVFDAGEQDGVYYITMELVEGTSLSAFTKKHGALPEKKALDFLLQAARGLDAAHGLGLVHRDIKPENMLANKKGGLKIVDFGLVLEATNDANLTRTGTFLGTPAYMSPEQCDGETADARSDLYSLGGTFYHILVGKPPYEATTIVGLIYKNRTDPVPDLRAAVPSVTDKTVTLFKKLMAKDRKERYQSAADLIPDVEAALEDAPALTATWSWEKLVSDCLQPMVALAPEQLRAPEQTVMRGKADITMMIGGPSGNQTQTLASNPTLLANPTPTPPQRGQMTGQQTLLEPAPGSMGRSIQAGEAQAAPPRRSKALMVVGGILLLAALGGLFFALQWKPKTLEAFLETVERHRTVGDSDAAQQELNLGLKYFPDSNALKELQSKVKDDKAQEDLKRAENLYRKKELDELVKKAIAAQSARDLDGAIRNYEAAERMGIDPNVPLKLKELKFEKFTAEAKKAETEGKLDEALQLSKQAGEFGDNKARVEELEKRIKGQAIQKSALEAVAREDWTAAVAALKSAVELYPKDASLSAGLESTLNLQRGAEAMQKQQWAGAKERFTAALGDKWVGKLAQAKLTEVEAWLCHEAGQRALERCEWEKALGEFRKAEGIAKDLQAPNLKGSLQSATATVTEKINEIAAKEKSALQAVEQGRVEQAVADYEALLKLCPASAQAYNQKLAGLKVEQAFRAKIQEGDSFLKSGAFKEARVAYQAALEVLSTPEAKARVQAKLEDITGTEQFMKGEAAAANKDWAKAKEYYDAAQKLVPAERLARFDQRWKELQEVLKELDALTTSVQSAVKKQQWQEAKTAYARLAVLNPSKRAEYEQGLATADASLRTAGEKAAKREKYQAQMDQAQQKVASGDLQGAITAARAALEIFPKDDAAQLILSQSEFTLAFSEDTAGNFEKYRAHIALLVEKGQLLEAEKVFKKCQEKYTLVSTAMAKTPDVFLPEEVAGIKSFGAESQTIQATLTSLAPVDRALKKALAALDEGLALLAKTAPQSTPVAQDLERAKNNLATTGSESFKLFGARKYFEAQSVAGVAAAKIPEQYKAALIKAAGDLEKLSGGPALQEAASALVLISKR